MHGISWEVYSEERVDKNLEGGNCGLLKDSTLTFVWGLRNTMNISVRIVVNLTDLNWLPPEYKHHHYSNLFHGNILHCTSGKSYNKIIMTSYSVFMC